VEILTYPIGLVVGLLPVVANLGPSGSPPGQLLLDGRAACVMTVETPKCTVDLGSDLHVHLLELVRTDVQGAVVERTTRWVNGPGAQAEIYLRGGCDKASGECTVSIGWGHPGKLDPRAMVVSLDGKPILREVQHEVRFRTEPGSDRVVSVDVIFPDGRRASQIRALGAGYAGFAEASLQAVPVVSSPGARLPETIGVLPVESVGDAAAEVAFVVEPLALEAMRTLWTRAWSEIRVPGAPLSQQINGELIFLEALTAVVPNEDLNRFDVFRLQGGRDAWLSRLAYGASALEGKAMRLADAVASAGMLVAGAPRKRAVVLVVSGRHRDESTFTPEQASRYLSDIMVPLVVWRVEDGVGKGWPDGPRITSKTILAAVKALRAGLDAQRIAWLEGSVNPALLRLPGDLTGVTIAGRVGAPPVAGAVAAAPAEEVVPTPPAQMPIAAPGRTVRGRVDVTAVRVLMRLEWSGRKPAPTLDPDEIEVLEDGAPVRVIGIDRVATADEARASAVSGVARPAPDLVPWNLVIYVVPDLCTRAGLARILDRVREEAQLLVNFGSATVVLADLEPRVLGLRLTNRAALEDVVGSAALRRLAPTRLVQRRRDFLTSIASPVNLTASLQDTQEGKKALTYQAKLGRASMAVVEEGAAVRDIFSRLVAWASADTSPGARVLFLAVDGFDLNPEEFYLDALDPTGQAPEELAAHQRAVQQFQAERLGPFVREASAALAEQGWTVVSFDNGVATLAGFANAAEQTGWGKLNTYVAGATSSGANFMFLDPREPLQVVSETTGGLIVPPGGPLRGALDALGSSLLVTYQVDRPADGRSHRVDVRCKRAGVTVTAPKLVYSGTARGESEMRARRILGGEKATGGLPVQLAALATGEQGKHGARSGELRVRADLSSVKDVLVQLGKARMRVTVAVGVAGAEAFVTHQDAEADPSQEGTSWGYVVPLTWPPEAKQVVVVVEELGTGAWGAARMDLPGAQ